MTAPNIPTQFDLPEKEQEQTYTELVSSLNCVCSGGVLIRPSGLLPSATVNIGDTIASITSHLTSFTSAYSMFLSLLRMITCIIEVICSLTNPFSLISAVIRLFSECLPLLILMFPLFLIPTIILCLIKIILSIIDYILESIVPIIEDIYRNIEDIRSAFSDGNKDAQVAVAFKISALIQELINIVGILAVLGALTEMIKSLMALGVGIPCSDGDGSVCVACGSERCPSLIQQDKISGTDGKIFFFYFDDDNYKLMFSSPSKSENFKTIREFFPSGLDYDNIPQDELPYLLNADGRSFAITSIEPNGNLNVVSVPNEFLDDGYFSTSAEGTPIIDPFIRFGTNTNTFNSSMVGRKIEIQDTRENTENNMGTWEIVEFYDNYNVRIEKIGGILTWAGSNTEINPEPFLLWRLIPEDPIEKENLTFSIDIHHDVLIKHGVIGAGCHPAIKSAREGVVNRFPELGEGDGSLNSAGLGNLPDVNALFNKLNDKLKLLGDPTTDAVLDGYNDLETALNNLDLETDLNTFAGDMRAYALKLCALIFDPEKTEVVVSPSIQSIGNDVFIQIIPKNKSGTNLAFDLPENMLEVIVENDLGDISPVEEIFDQDGETTGIFQTTLSSKNPVSVNLKIKICERYVSDFNGATLVDRDITATFITPEDYRNMIETSTEPLGK